MTDISYDEYGWPRPKKEGRPALKLLLALALLATAGALAGIVMLPAESQREEATPQVRGVTDLVYPASLVDRLAEPANGQWVLPAGLTVTPDGSVFVLDTENNRILALDATGRVTATFDSTSDERLDLRGPMAIASDGRSLYVANSLAAQVLVLDLSGHVQKTISLEPVSEAALTPRPIGLALAPDGNIAVADADNHVVLLLDPDGTVLKTIGTGARATGSDGFNVPGALTLDGDGNLYVVDTLNGRVVKLSPDGTFIRQFGELGDTAGALARPKGVAVDPEGNVFVSDGLTAAVQVFSPAGDYLGLIGRSDPTDPASGSVFQAPAGLWLDGTRLYVMDRLAGLITLDLIGLHPLQASAGGERGG
jgi:DNA-binding beta-propeller fold protein YncE